MTKEKILTSRQIAEKYVYGLHDALTDNQEVKDMTADIEKLIATKQPKQDYCECNGGVDCFSGRCGVCKLPKKPIEQPKQVSFNKEDIALIYKVANSYDMDAIRFEKWMRDKLTNK